MSEWDRFPVAGAKADAAPAADPWAGFPEARPARGAKRAVADDLTRAAPFTTQLRAGLAVSDDDKIRRYAAARFPTVPIDEAVKRYGIIDGQIVYADPSGNYVREVPSVGGPPGTTIGDKAIRAGRYVGSQTGPALPQVSAAVTGLATQNPMAAGATAAGVDVVRQAADKALAGEDPTDISLLNTAGHAAEAAGGQFVGNRIARAFDRNPLRVGDFDRTAARSPEVQQRSADITAKAQREGIPLTAGESTGLPSLLDMERQLRDKPETADMFGDMFDKRVSDYIPTALDRYKTQLSPKGTMAEQTTAVRTGAKSVINKAQGERTGAASPYYKRAFESGATLDPAPLVANLDARLTTAKGEMQSALSTARGYIATGKPLSIAEAHDAKLAIDALIEGRGDKSISKATKRELVSLQKDLVQSMGAASPDYEAGRAAFESLSPRVRELADGVVGSLAKNREGIDTLANARWVFDPARSTPEAVAQTRQAFEGAGQGDAWNALVRSYIDDSFARSNIVNASGEKGNVPGKFFKSMFGDQRSRDILRSATDPGFYNRFKDFMDVMEAAAKSKPAGSRTATDIGQDPKMPDTISGVANFTGKALSPSTYANLPDRIAQGIVEMRSPEARRKLAAALLDPEASKQLAKLRMLSPKSRKAMEITTQFLTVAGIGAADPEPKDRLPSASE
jgi:hypothetical protein